MIIGLYFYIFYYYIRVCVCVREKKKWHFFFQLALTLTSKWRVNRVNTLNSLFSYSGWRGVDYALFGFNFKASVSHEKDWRSFIIWNIQERSCPRPHKDAHTQLNMRPSHFSIVRPTSSQYTRNKQRSVFCSSLCKLKETKLFSQPPAPYESSLTPVGEEGLTAV